MELLRLIVDVNVHCSIGRMLCRRLTSQMQQTVKVVGTEHEMFAAADLSR